MVHNSSFFIPHKVFEGNIGFRDKLPTDPYKNRIDMMSTISIKLIYLMLLSKFGPNRTGELTEDLYLFIACSLLIGKTPFELLYRGDNRHAEHN